MQGYNNFDSGFAFGYDDPAFGAMASMMAYQRKRVSV
jgi:hypothetical protein